MNKILYTLVVLMLLEGAASATTGKAPVDDLEGATLIGQLQFNGTGNYTLDLDAPQMEYGLLINLINLTNNATYQLTFTARPRED